MPDATHYTYRVAWFPEDGEHVATVVEFPSLSWLVPTQAEALGGIADVVRDVLADQAASGERFPSRRRNALTLAGSWCVSWPRSTVALSARPPSNA